MIRKYIIPLLSVLLLTGCGVYRHYERPDVRTENLYTQYEPSDITTIADKKWNELFTDPCLQKLMEQAEEVPVLKPLEAFRQFYKAVRGGEMTKEEEEAMERIVQEAKEDEGI